VGIIIFESDILVSTVLPPSLLSCFSRIFAEGAGMAAHLTSDAVAGSVRARLAPHAEEDALDEAVIEYLGATAEDILQSEKQVDAAADSLVEALSPLLEDYVGAESIREVCVGIAEDCLKGAAGEGDDLDTTESSEKEPCALELHGVILAFAGRVLLKSSDILLHVGHRYGLVGPNGAGKTTLLNKLAAGDFMGFPQSLSIVYIQHEVHGEGDESCVEYLKRMSATEGCAGPADEDGVRRVLGELGFTPAMQDSGIVELSGGWRMRLAIGRSMLARATLLLLDEPTNHLDKHAVAWLTKYLQEQHDTTILFVSHDAPFLDGVATDIIHLNNGHLDFHKCSFNEFRERVPTFRLHTNIDHGGEDGAGPDCGHSNIGDVQASGGESDSAILCEQQSPQFMVGDALLTMSFPDPGPLDGIKSRNKVIMKGVDIHYRYPGAERDILKGASVRVMLSSRVALMGPNGAGKTTLIKLLIGELELSAAPAGASNGAASSSANSGEIFRHHNLRISYIAQHSMHHLGANLDMTPLEYIQNRFYFGEDKEVGQKVTMQLSDEEVALSQMRGNVGEVIGRRVHGNHVEYECVKNGRRTGDTVWEPVVNIKYMHPYVMKMCRHYDEKMKLMAARTGLRGLTYEHIQRHLDKYGIRRDLSRFKIKRMSGGQRSRLVIAAAMWTKPHILVLDEPTNFLDNETMLALVEAIRTYKGGVLLISHNEQFVNNVSTSQWVIDDGVVLEKSSK